MTTSAPTHSLTGRIRQLIDTNHGTLRGLVRTLLGQCEYLAGRLEPHTGTDAGSIERLVFVCLGNINRSAFAEQVALTLGARTCSIGLSTTTGKPAFRTAVTTATGFGIDLGAHKATDLS
jgi:protein-tyrosine phosphatase